MRRRCCSTAYGASLCNEPGAEICRSLARRGLVEQSACSTGKIVAPETLQRDDEERHAPGECKNYVELRSQ